MSGPVRTWDHFGKQPSPDAPGPAVHDQVANWFKQNPQGADSADLKRIMDKSAVPENISMGIPHINTPIGEKLPKQVKELDRKVQGLQKAAAASVS